MEGTGESHLPIAGYGRLRLLVIQGPGNVRGTPRDMALACVAHWANLGQHNQLSVKRLAQFVDVPM